MFTLTVITPSLIVFLFRITIPIGLRINFFGIVAESNPCTHTHSSTHARAREPLQPKRKINNSRTTATATVRAHAQFRTNTRRHRRPLTMAHLFRNYSAHTHTLPDPEKVRCREFRRAVCSFFARSTCRDCSAVRCCPSASSCFL